MLNLQRALRERKTPLELVQTPVVAVEREKRSITRRIREVARDLLPPNARMGRLVSTGSEHEDGDDLASPSGGEDEFDGTGSPGDHFTARYPRRPFFTRF